MLRDKNCVGRRGIPADSIVAQIVPDKAKQTARLPRSRGRRCGPRGINGKRRFSPIAHLVSKRGLTMETQISDRRRAGSACRSDTALQGSDEWRELIFRSHRGGDRPQGTDRRSALQQVETSQSVRGQEIGDLSKRPGIREGGRCARHACTRLDGRYLRLPRLRNMVLIWNTGIDRHGRHDRRHVPGHAISQRIVRGHSFS